MLEHLILHLLTILIPIVAIQAFMLDRFHFRKSWRFQLVAGCLSGLSAILCMTFPVQMESGFIWDYRWIPQTMAILYGGYGAGAIAMILSLAYRAYIGGDVALLAFVGNLLFVIVPFFSAKGFLDKPRSKRYFIGLGVSLASFVFVAIMFVFWSQISKLNELSAYYRFIALAGIIQLLLTALCLFIIEKAMELSRIREHMYRSEQMSVVSQLAASVAHEVRNPLTTIRGFLQLTQATADPKLKSYMTVSLEELDRAEAIISDYLNFAKPLVEKTSIVNATELLNNAVILMNSYAVMNKVSLSSDLAKGLHISADRAKLNQVIMNILKNAIEATPPGGSVEVSAFFHANDVFIRVKDTGVGMSTDELKRLGIPFFTTKSNGTGLGLSVSFRLVEGMQGKLEYESAKGAGTTAVLRFPAIVEPSEVKLSIVK